MIMNNRFIPLFVVALIAFAPVAHAQKAEADDATLKAEAEKLIRGLKYQHGEITLKGGVAKMTVPDDFNFLGPEDTKTVLEKLWDNPPSDDILGLLLPAKVSLLDEHSWAVTISYDEDGHVKDTDASKINY